MYLSQRCHTCILIVSQKSKDKNTSLEEQHRRNEISMRRKQQQVQSPTALSDESAPKSPASTGAMDDLLQKLRAAKPEARDQRDRRRRAAGQRRDQHRCHQEALPHAPRKRGGAFIHGVSPGRSSCPSFPSRGVRRSPVGARVGQG